MFRVCQSFALLIGLAGCALPTGPDTGRDPLRGAHAAADHWQIPVAAGLEAPTPPGGPISLPEAVQSCVISNLRLQALGEKVSQAQADYWTSSLLPNPELFTDYQLIPLQPVDITRQAGPPQFDFLVTIPIDWCLFGKRVATMEAARLGVAVAGAEYSDKIRQRVSETVLAFYDLLEAEELAKLAKSDVADIQRVADTVQKKVEKGGAGTIENDRLRLAVLDAQREVRKREGAIESARARLLPLLGRRENDASFGIRGTLDIAKAAPSLTLEQALALAEQHRPDLRAGQLTIQQAHAGLERERRRAKPIVSVTPGYNYQHQKYITGFRDAHLATFGLTTTLPVADRNQGNIQKAMSTIRESELNLQADLEAVRSEVALAMVEYKNALVAITSEDPAHIAAAKIFRDGTEKAYAAGQNSLADILDAQRDYRERIRSTVTNRADYWRALQRVHAAIGARVLPEEAAKAP